MLNEKKRKGSKYIPDTAYLATDGAPASVPDHTDMPALKQAKVLGDVAASHAAGDGQGVQTGGGEFRVSYVATFA